MTPQYAPGALSYPLEHPVLKNCFSHIFRTCGRISATAYIKTSCDFLIHNYQPAKTILHATPIIFSICVFTVSRFGLGGYDLTTITISFPEVIFCLLRRKTSRMIRLILFLATRCTHTLLLTLIPSRLCVNPLAARYIQNQGDLAGDPAA